MKISRIVIILLSLILFGCMSKNLHLVDRIPHEIQKGYVQFECVYNIQGKVEVSQIIFTDIKHTITKIEHGNEIDIYKAPIGYTMKPITDRVGEHVYIVKFPYKVTFSKIGPNAFEKAQFVNNFSKGIINVQIIPKITANWEIREEKVNLPVKEGMITLVKLDLTFTPEKETNIYKGTLKYSVEDPKPYQEKPIELVQDATGPRHYQNQYDEVFSGVIKTVEKLGWNLEDHNRASGRVVTKISRFSRSQMLFTIIIHQTNDARIRVDLSSNPLWQRLGSINTGKSIEKIAEFYRALDTILAVSSEGGVSP